MIRRFAIAIAATLVAFFQQLHAGKRMAQQLVNGCVR